jgi:hypothetical protein
MQKIIQIYPCLLKLLRKQESVTDNMKLSVVKMPLIFYSGDMET